MVCKTVVGKNRIYLIDHNDNLAHRLFTGKKAPKKYIKVPIFRSEYAKMINESEKIST